MNRKQLIQNLLDAARTLEEGQTMSDMDFAADFASILSVQASNLGVHLQARRKEFERGSDNEEFLRQAADQTRPITAYAAEIVWCLRQVNERIGRKEP